MITAGYAPDFSTRQGAGKSGARLSCVSLAVALGFVAAPGPAPASEPCPSFLLSSAPGFGPAVT
jgi:hypothetical protein